MFTPRLEYYPKKVEQNAKTIVDICHKGGVSVSAVTKVTAALPEIAKAFVAAGADSLADSRIENLREIKKLDLGVELLLLRLPTLSRVDEVVEVADISLVSSWEVMQALGSAAAKIGKVHKSVLMVDVGDLREGVMPEMVLPLVKNYQANPIAGLDLIGLGVNLACFGGVVPSVQNTSVLIDLKKKINKVLGLDLDYISGGNSSGLPLLISGKLPQGINQYRIGESILLGCNVADRSAFSFACQDGFVAVFEIIELIRKPSVPIGERAQDAFGGMQDFKQRGERLRAICNVGRQDVNIDGLTPVEDGIDILGGSSDHLILDVEEYKGELAVGSQLSFYPDYGALLALSTSSYVQKVKK